MRGNRNLAEKRNLPMEAVPGSQLADRTWITSGQCRAYRSFRNRTAAYLEAETQRTGLELGKERTYSESRRYR